jgi:hypothetical protein
MVDSTIALDQSVAGFALLFTGWELAIAKEFGARIETWLSEMIPSKSETAGDLLKGMLLLLFD